MVTGSNSTPEFVWWASSESAEPEATRDVYVVYDGRRFPFLITSSGKVVAVGALDPGDWSGFKAFLGPGVSRVRVSQPSQWFTLIPDALWTHSPIDWSIWGAPSKELHVFHAVKQKLHVVFASDLPPGTPPEWTDWQEQSPRVPSEALDWEFPHRTTERWISAQVAPHSIALSALDRDGALVFANRFEAATLNDALYVLGLAYEHTGWNGLEVPLYWHGHRPDFPEIVQGLSSFVLDIKPTPPPKSLPEELGDWRIHPSLQTLFKLWICAS